MSKPQKDKQPKLSYKEVERLIDTQLKNCVILTGRARRSLKKAEYQDPYLVWKSVELLKMYRRIPKDEFLQRCYELGLDYQKSSTEITAGNYPEKYFMLYNGKRRRIDFHLTKGSAKEPRKCMRIYFFWDEDNKQVVIGHLPSHLINSKT